VSGTLTALTLLCVVLMVAPIGARVGDLYRGMDCPDSIQWAVRVARQEWEQSHRYRTQIWGHPLIKRIELCSLSHRHLKCSLPRFLLFLPLSKKSLNPL